MARPRGRSTARMTRHPSRSGALAALSGSRAVRHRADAEEHGRSGDLWRPLGGGGGGTRAARVSESILITRGCKEIRPIGDRRSVIVGLFGLKWT